MMRKFLLVIGFMALVPLQASAATFPAPVTQVACSPSPAAFFMIQPWYSCLEVKDGVPQLDELSDVILIIFSIVESLVKVAAYVAVGVIFYMIFKMLTARGDTGKIASAGLGIRDALIGLVIALSSVAIINFVASGIQ